MYAKLISAGAGSIPFAGCYSLGRVPTQGHCKTGADPLVGICDWGILPS